MLREDLLRGGEAVERRRKAGIDRHLNDGFDDLGPGAADIQGGVQVHLELRRRVPIAVSAATTSNSLVFKSSPGRE